MDGIKANRPRVFIGADARIMQAMKRLLPMPTLRATGRIVDRLSGR